MFQNVDTPLDNTGGYIFTSPSTTENEVCYDYLGHDCQLNAFGSSGSFDETDTEFFSDFDNENIASAAEASTVVDSVTETAGFGLVSY